MVSAEVLSRRFGTSLTPLVRGSRATKSASTAPASQSRPFIGSLLNTPLRKLSHTKTLPYASTAIFKAVSDVSGYPSFLPFTIASDVTKRDAAGYPEEAKLKVGYAKFGIEEDWDSLVSCNADKGTIEARSSEQNSGGLFEVLSTKWQIQPAENNQKDQTVVKLDVDVKFRNAVYDQMFAQFEERVASVMISAFEKRVRQIEDGSTT